MREIKCSLLIFKVVLTRALVLLQLLTFVYTELDLYVFAVPIYTGVYLLTLFDSICPEKYNDAHDQIDSQECMNDNAFI